MRDEVEVDTTTAGRLIGLTRQRIHDHVVSGVLPARQVGMSRRVWIRLSDLRQFAETYNYDWHEDVEATVER